MDIDEFLDRELSDLGLQTDKAENTEAQSQFKENFETSPLFESIRINLGKGNLELAEQSYEQLWHLLMQQKLKWDRELYDQLSVLSRQFSGALNNAYTELKRKADSIYALIARARSALKEGQKDMPFKIYSEIEELSNSIPNVFFEEKRMVQEQIMDFYRELKGTTDNGLMQRVSALMAEINQLIEKISRYISSNDMINAILNYNRCMELYSQVPEGFLKYKNQADIKLVEIYKALSIYNEISNLQRQLSQQAQGQMQQASRPARANEPSSRAEMAMARKDRAKRNIEKGFYNEASKDIQEALQLEPGDAEAKAMHAKIKTLQ